MKSVLVDTSFIVALLDRDERAHSRCKSALRGLSAPLISCEAVIAEACYLLRNIPGAQDAVLANVSNGSFQIAFDLSLQSIRVRALLRQYGRVPMDLADACLVCMAEEFETGRILTLDNDFNIYRWAGNKRFEMLLLPQISSSTAANRVKHGRELR